MDDNFKSIEELLPVNMSEEGVVKGFLRDLYNLAGGRSDNFTKWAESNLAKVRPDGMQYTKVWRTKEGTFLKTYLPEDDERYLTGLGNFIDYIVDIEVLEHISMGMGFAPRASNTMKELSYQCREYYISIRKKYQREKEFKLLQENERLQLENKQQDKKLSKVKGLWFPPTQFCDDKTSFDKWMVDNGYIKLNKYGQVINCDVTRVNVKLGGKYYKVSFDTLIEYKSLFVHKQSKPLFK